MAYNPYSAVKEIYKYKGQWDSANSQGNETAKSNAAKKAQDYYNQLRQNGYSDVADELTAADYTQAKKINDKWAKMSKTPTRSYLYTLGQKYGMSNSDVDKIISWDNDTGQVSVGGKVVGTPDAVVDGTSYWSDTKALDDAFDSYISNSGITRSNATAVKQENENLFSKYNKEYEDLKNTNPFTTDEAKAILAKYDLAGLQGRDNAVASNAGSNGGNIDSFAAANALRQQASLTSQGQEAVLSAYQQKLDNARNLLSDMGVNIDRVYNQDETTKNNDTARKSEIASVTGYVPDEWVASNNPYMNDDGTIKEEYKDVDFSDVMAKAKAAGNNEAYQAAATARYYKIMSNYGLYGQYDDGNYSVPGQQKTEAAREFDENIAQADRALNAEVATNAANNATTERVNAANNQNALDQIELAAKYKTSSDEDSTSSTKSSSDTTAKSSSDGSVDLLTGSGTTEIDESEWKEFYNEFSEKKSIQKFLNDAVKGQIYDNAGVLNGDVLADKLIQLIKNNTQTYDIDVEDARRICNKFGVDTTWLNDYKNRWGFNSGKGIKEK